MPYVKVRIDEVVDLAVAQLDPRSCRYMLPIMRIRSTLTWSALVRGSVVSVTVMATIMGGSAAQASTSPTMDMPVLNAELLPRSRSSVEPDQMRFMIAAHNDQSKGLYFFTDLRWTSWGSETATATGNARYYDANADYEPATTPVTLTVSGLRQCFGILTYTTVAATASPGSRPLRAADAVSAGRDLRCHMERGCRLGRRNCSENHHFGWTPFRLSTAEARADGRLFGGYAYLARTMGWGSSRATVTAVLARSSAFGAKDCRSKLDQGACYGQAYPIRLTYTDPGYCPGEGFIYRSLRVEVVGSGIRYFKPLPSDYRAVRARLIKQLDRRGLKRRVATGVQKRRACRR